MSSKRKPTVTDLLKTSDYEGAYNLMIRNGDNPEKILDYLSMHYFQKNKFNHNKYWTFISSNSHRFVHYDSEIFILALSKYFERYDDSFKSLIVEISEKAPEALIQAIRHSRFFLDAKNKSWNELDFLKYHPSQRINDLHNVLYKVSQVDRDYLNRIAIIKKKITHLSIYQLIGYIALYSAKHITPLDLINNADSSDSKMKFHYYVEALTDILKEKLESITIFPSSDNLFEDIVLSIIDYKHNEKSSILADKIKKVSSGVSDCQDKIVELFNYIEYKLNNESEFFDFEEYIKEIINYNSFKSGFLDTFCYDTDYDFKVENEKVLLTCNNEEKFEKWESGNEKIKLSKLCFLNRAVDEFSRADYSKMTFGKKEYDLENKNAFINALATSLMMSDFFGIDKITSIDSSCSVDYFSFAHNFNSLSTHFQHDFINPFLLSLKECNNNCLNALKKIQHHALKERFADRSIIRIYEEEKLLDMIERNIKIHPQNNGDTREQARVITQKLSWNLESGKHYNKSLIKTPLLKINEQYVVIPWIFGYLDMDTLLQNAILEQEKSRSRKVEVDTAGSKTADFMKQAGFNVECNVDYNDNKTNASGEIDILAYKEGHLFILEMKTTYLRISLREAWLHRVTNLRKAGEQLQKINNWIINNFDEISGLLQIQEKFENLKIHSWIIDTSFEFDHEKINGFLKINLLEFIIALSNWKSYLINPEYISKKLNLPFNKLNDIDSINAIIETTEIKSALNLKSFDLYKNRGFSSSRFVEIIENGEVWSGMIDAKTGEAPVYKC